MSNSNSDPHTISHIRHFFYTGRILENQILHPKKTTKGTKNTKNVSEKVKYMHFFSLNLEKFTPDKNFLHRNVCGVCDKYEVWSAPAKPPCDQQILDTEGLGTRDEV